MTAFAIVVLAFAWLPAMMIVRNLREFAKLTSSATLIERAKQIGVSVLIPARNEAEGIAVALRSLMACSHPSFEVIVLDDQSEDDTAAIVRQLQGEFPQLGLVSAPSLPAGWNGKQHACWQLAQLAKNDLLIFLDADVRVTPEAISRIVAFHLASECPLTSGFPEQLTVTLSEKLLIPMMHFLLLGYLPLWKMKATTHPAFAAGCGQLMVADRQTYFLVDGHRSIKNSRHDGIQLPRVYRRSGFRTDLFDAMDVASCRMYRNFSEVVRGVLKNAQEGIANSRLIFVFTLLLGLGVLMPPILLLVGLLHWDGWSMLIMGGIATLVGVGARGILCWRFRQPWWLALCHPLSVAWFLILQWYAWIRSFVAGPIRWRGRI